MRATSKLFCCLGIWATLSLAQDETNQDSHQTEKKSNPIVYPQPHNQSSPIVYPHPSGQLSPGVFPQNERNAIRDNNIKLITQDAKVQKKLQGKFLEIFYDLPAETTTAYALFSSGGWSDAGQFLVFGDKYKSSFRFAKPNIQAFMELKQEEVPHEKWEHFWDVISGVTQLENIDAKAFDGVQYEILKIVRQGGQLVLSKRVFMNNPEFMKNKPVEHLSIIHAFMDLVVMDAKQQSNKK